MYVAVRHKEQTYCHLECSWPLKHLFVLKAWTFLCRVWLGHCRLSRVASFHCWTHGGGCGRGLRARGGVPNQGPSHLKLVLIIHPITPTLLHLIHPGCVERFDFFLATDVCIFHQFFQVENHGVLQFAGLDIIQYHEVPLTKELTVSSL